VKRWATKRRVLLLTIAISFLGVASSGLVRDRLTSSSDRDEATVDSRVSATEYPRIVPALCDAQDALQKANLTRAYNAFWGQAHRGLHVLVVDLNDRGEREVAGKLLRSKNRVESSIISGGPLAVAAVNDLQVLTIDALTRVGASASSCSE
jgi:hypothetical protein